MESWSWHEHSAEVWASKSDGEFKSHDQLLLDSFISNETNKTVRIDHCTVQNQQLPALFTMSLSIPLGPSVVLTASAINWHAFMLLMS